MNAPLVLAAHGSPHPAHRPAVDALRRAVAAATGADVRVGWLEHARPSVPAAVRAAALGGRRPVVAPLLLAAGHHARVDLPRLLRDLPVVRLAPVLGPDPLLAVAVDRRLREAGAQADAHVVLAGAGSSDPDALAQVEEVGALLAELRATTVTCAYASGAGDRVDAVVRRLAARGRRVVVATYLLGPGALADRVRRRALAAGAEVVSEPIGVAPELVELVRRRWAASGVAASRPAA